MFRLLHLTNIHTHPIIDLIRRERENMHARQEKEGERLEILFSLSTFFCICMCVSKKSRENFDSTIHIHTPEISLSVRFASSSTSIDVRKEKNEEIAKDIKPMAHLTIVTKRYCALLYTFRLHANN
jgi:hypothetical protein